MSFLTYFVRHFLPAMLCWLAVFPVCAQAPLAAPNLGLIGGSVSAIVRQMDGKVVFGGNFSDVNGVARNNIARLNADGTLDISWDANADGDVTALALDGAGNIYAGGVFSTIGGQTRNRIAQLNTTNGTATAWNANADGVVNSLILDGSGYLYAGGGFTTIGGLARAYIAKLDTATGAAVTAWDATAGGVVNAMVLDGAGNLYVGGGFTAIGGLARNRIAQLSTVGGTATGWNANADGTVTSLALDGTGNLYAGGGFTNIGGQARNHIAMLDATGVATAWDANSNSTVFSLTLDGLGNIYAGGDFTAVGGQTRSNIAQISTATGAATAWNASANNPVFILALGGAGNIYAGGNFTTIGGQSRWSIARLDSAGGAGTAGFVGNAHGIGKIFAIAHQPDGKMVVGGAFNMLSDGTMRNNLLRLNADSTLDSTWNPNANGTVNTLAPDGAGYVYAGGVFTVIGGQIRNHIAKLDISTAAATAWDANANDIVNALILDGTGNLYVGGDFTSIGGQTRNHIAKLDTTTGSATAWNADANGTVNALGLDGTGNLYAGGGFTAIGGQTRNRIAKLDSANAAASAAWDANASNTVNALTLDGTGNLYVGGGFTTVGGQARNRIAKLDTATGAAAAWNANADGAVITLALDGAGNIYTGGDFTTIGGQARNRIAKLDTATGSATAWDAGADGRVSALALDGAGKIYTGGGFATIGGQSRSGLAAYSSIGNFIPEAFTFTSQVGVAVNTTITSNSITVSGIDTISPISISGGSYSINGGAYTTVAGTVSNGNTVTVKLASSGSFNMLTTATVTIGGVSGAFSVTTQAVDTIPDAFTFTDQTGATLKTSVTSNVIVVAGINSPTPISISGGSYAVNSGTYTTTAGTVNNGNTVTVMLTSSASFNTATIATLTVGGVAGAFNVTTQAVDTAPDAFTFTSQIGVARSTAVTSNTIGVSGINTVAPISVSGGSYAINGGAYTTVAGTVKNGDTVNLTLISSDSLNTPVTATLTIGETVGTFTATTEAVPTSLQTPSGPSTPITSPGQLMANPDANITVDSSGAAVISAPPAQPYFLSQTATESALVKLPANQPVGITSGITTLTYTDKSGDSLLLVRTVNGKPQLEVAKGVVAITSATPGIVIPLTSVFSKSLGTVTTTSGADGITVVKTDNSTTLFVDTGKVDYNDTGQNPVGVSVFSGESAKLNNTGSKLDKVTLGSYKGLLQVPGDPLPTQPGFAPDTLVPKLDGALPRYNNNVSLLDILRVAFRQTLRDTGGKMDYDNTSGVLSYTIGEQIYRLMPLGEIQLQLDQPSPDGITATASGAFNLVTQSVLLKLSGAVSSFSDLDQAVKALDANGTTALTADGTLDITLSGKRYVGTPAFTASVPASPSPTPGFETGSDGFVVFRDHLGMLQTLYPAFLDVNSVVSALRRKDPAASLTNNFNGTLSAVISGQPYTLLPDYLVISTVYNYPVAAWWVEGDMDYIYNSDHSIQGFKKQ